MMLTEQTSPAQEHRTTVFGDDVEQRLFHALRDHLRDEHRIALLISGSYFGLPYVWNLARAQTLTPIGVDAAWGRLLEHFDDPDAPRDLRPPALREMPGLHGTLEGIVRGWEDHLGSLAVQGGRLCLCVLRTQPDTDYVQHGFFGQYSTDPHPLTGVWDTEENPLPVWRVNGTDQTTWRIGFLPVAVADHVTAYAMRRDHIHHAAWPSHAISFVTVEEDTLQAWAARAGRTLPAALYLQTAASVTPNAAAVRDLVLTSLAQVVRRRSGEERDAAIA